jgi:uncharacterized protein YndB with AHSA1/START domain
MAEINHLFHINAPREKVYEAISTVDGLSNWWTKETNGSSKVGDEVAFSFGNHTTTMKVTELKPNEMVQWECVNGFPDWIGTTLSFKLDENEGKTRVRFKHDNWKEADDFLAACSFSWSKYLESMRQLCQTGKGEAFGSDNYRR